MPEFLRWLGAIGLPIASFGVGFAFALLIISPQNARAGALGTLAISAASAFICAMQLIGDPVISPIWLQYLILSAVPALVGSALLVRPRRTKRMPRTKEP